MRSLLIAFALLLAGTMSAGAVQVLGPDGKPLRLPICGGWPGYECSDSEWCDYPEIARCGIGDIFGRCKPRPQNCFTLRKPVCGCDGNDYGNSCEAKKAGQDVAYVGKCR